MTHQTNNAHLKLTKDQLKYLAERQDYLDDYRDLSDHINSDTTVKGDTTISVTLETSSVVTKWLNVHYESASTSDGIAYLVEQAVLSELDQEAVRLENLLGFK